MRECRKEIQGVVKTFDKVWLGILVVNIWMKVNRKKFKESSSKDCVSNGQCRYQKSTLKNGIENRGLKGIQISN